MQCSCTLSETAGEGVELTAVIPLSISDSLCCLITDNKKENKRLYWDSVCIKIEYMKAQTVVEKQRDNC